MLIVALSHAVVGEHQHTVARKDGGIGVPLLVNGFMTTAKIGIVHQVVVQQGIVVISLQSDGVHQDFLRVFLEYVVAQEHQNRTNALASERENILHWLI